MAAGLKSQRQKERCYFLIWWVLDSPASQLSHILYDLSISMNQTQKLICWSSSTDSHSPEMLSNFYVICQYLLSFFTTLFNIHGQNIWRRSRVVPIRLSDPAHEHSYENWGICGFIAVHPHIVSCNYTDPWVFNDVLSLNSHLGKTLLNWICPSPARFLVILKGSFVAWYITAVQLSQNHRITEW